MKHSKKSWIILLVAVLAVVVVGTVTTTYAWFLSRYNRDYEFVLESESFSILKFESELNFASGERSSSQNVLIPAKAKHLNGIEQQALDPFDVFDNTPSTGAVASAAQAVKFTASGAYWTGDSASAGRFLPLLQAYPSVFVSENQITQNNLVTKLGTAAVVRNDLVTRNEIEFFMIFNYLGTYFLYYDGAFYVVESQEQNADFTLPAVAEPDDDFRYWIQLDHTSRITYGTSLQVIDNMDTYFLLQPNTRFSFTLYVFVEKTDEELDPEINGEAISLFLTLKQFAE